MSKTIRAFGWRPTIIVFAVVSVVYGLLAWNRILEPSPQYHFIDLAQSFLDGRLDTNTPDEHSTRPRDDDPKGYRAALARTEKAGGWNDWSMVRRITTVDGEVFLGRYPWEGDQGERKWIFWTTDNRELKLTRDAIAKTCGERGRSPCDERLYYISFPPVPALVFLPFVTVFGYDTNDVLITVLVGGINAVLLFWFLQLLVQRGHSTRSVRDNLWLTFAFAFGTVAFFVSVRGEVWFTALVFGIALNLGFMLAALDLRHPIWAGILLGLAFGTRTPILFCGMFFAWQLFFPGNVWFLRDRPRRETLVATARKALLFGVPLMVIFVALGLYNIARFSEFGEFGHSYLQGGAYDRVRDHGMFGFAYLNRNLLSGLVAMPRFSTDAPYVLVSNHGLGMLVTTPILLTLMRPMQWPPLRRALWLAVLAAAVPGFFYQNTGWVQFGYRFALDFLPYLFALLAVEGRPLSKTAKTLIIIGIIVNLFGAVTFGRMPHFYYETMMPGAT